MRLLRCVDGKICLTKDLNRRDIPQYAILSHTWGPDEEEVTYKDLVAGAGEDKAGYDKIRFCAKQAARDGLQHFWIDSCCIDKANYTELYEAINSMFRWYQNATRCYVYLVDVSIPQPTIPSRRLRDRPLKKKRKHEPLASVRPFGLAVGSPVDGRCKNFLAPPSVEFFSKDGQRLGDKTSLEKEIHEITGIAISALRGADLSEFDVNERFRWAEKRETTREEDAIYSLLGIFGVFMSLRYGQGKEKEAARLREKLGKRDKAPPLPFATIPFRRDPHFVNRDVILDQVKRRCSEPAGRAALVGLGGIGKSQLAIEFAHQFDEGATGSWLFWIHASTRARADEGFQAIADAVNLPERAQPKADIPQLVYNWLSREQNGRWMMIIDSADDADVFYGSTARPDGRNLASFLPQSRNGSILVTTRNKELARRLTGQNGIIEVGVMAEAEALSLLENKAGPITDLGAASELVRTLEYMPLAINQAAGFIQARAPRSSVEKYLADFRESESSRTKLLGHDMGDLRRDGSASNAVLTTWQLSFEHIHSKRRSAADLLSLMSFFNCQGIPESLLQPTGQTSNSEREDESDSDDGDCNGMSTEFEDDIGMLKDFCLLSMNETGTEFEMHGLVQLSTRKWLEAKGFEEEFKGQFLTRLGVSFPDGKYENWEVCRKLFPHVEAAIEYTPTREDMEEVWARILYNGAWYARVQGRYNVAEQMACQAKRSHERLLGVEDANTLSSTALFASILQDKGKWIKAEELLVKTVEVQKRKLGPNHSDTLTSMANLASTYSYQGRWDQAEELGVEVLEASKRTLGADHRDTLVSMANLALIYSNQGRWDQAEELGVEVLEASKRTLGADHPDTLASMANLALIYSNQGRWDQAEELGVEVLEASKRTLGADHPDTLTSMANLALTYSNQGRWDQAEELGVEVLEASKRTLGADHPDTLAGIANLASTYSNQGRWDQAEELEVEVLEISKRTLGAGHPDTLTSMNNLAWTWKRQNRHTDALKLMESCAEARQRVLGPQHPYTLCSFSALNEWRENGHLSDDHSSDTTQSTTRT